MHDKQRGPIYVALTFSQYCIPEGRRHGKTVIFTKNISSEKVDDDSQIEDSDCDVTDSDESMSDGHPSKKQKIS